MVIKLYDKTADQAKLLRLAENLFITPHIISEIIHWTNKPQDIANVDQFKEANSNETKAFKIFILYDSGKSTCYTSKISLLCPQD